MYKILGGNPPTLFCAKHEKVFQNTLQMEGQITPTGVFG